MESANREILWNVSSTLDVVTMYSLLTVALVIAGAGLVSRVELWTSGKSSQENLGNWMTRLDTLCLNGLLQRKVVRQGIQAAFHTMIYLGFLVLLFTTTMVFIDHDLGIKIYHGRFYLLVTVLSDLFGVVLLLGAALAWHRRALSKTDQIHTQPIDFFALAVLALLVIQGYLLEGLRIHVTHDRWAAYSPVGLATAKLVWGLSPLAASVMHYLVWWFHTLTVFLVVAILPYTKFFHIISSSANIFFKNLNRPLGQMKPMGDLEQLMSSEEELSLGVNSLAHMSWKDLLSLDACTSCGRCQDACPAYASGTPLSPKWIVLDSRNHALAVHASKIRSDSILPTLMQNIDRWLIQKLLLGGSGITPSAKEPGKYDAQGSYRSANPKVQQSVLLLGGTYDSPLADGVIDQSAFWSCTTCMACVEACPVEISPMEHILETRRHLTLMEGSLPSEAQATLRALENRGNPYGPSESRAEWVKTAGLNIQFLQPGASVDYLYWVGCVSSFDARKQKIAVSLSKIMEAAGLSFGILGNAEGCSGDPARRLGEENLFQTLAKGNLATLREVTFKTLVTNCPHCYNTMANEYSEFGELQESAQPEIIHHSVLLERLLHSGRIKLSEADETVTFHDPCYLGRFNGEYDAPRDTLRSVPGLKIVEMERSREKSMCCGAGGGHFWMDLKNGDRINSMRTEQAAETNAKCIATACPFCMQMMEDGAKLTGREDTLIVRDIAEIVAERLIEV